MISWIAAHSSLRSFQTRYWLPVVPLFLIFASLGITKLRHMRTVFMVCLTCSILFSSAVLIFQKDSFGDVKRVALWTRNNIKDSTVYSDEIVKTG